MKLATMLADAVNPIRGRTKKGIAESWSVNRAEGWPRTWDRNNKQNRSRFLGDRSAQGTIVTGRHSWERELLPLEARRPSVEGRAARAELAAQLKRWGRTEKENAMRAYVLGAAMLLVLTAPTLAEEFYVVQNPTTKKCTIVTEKPTTTTITTVVGGTTYTTRTEAQNALRTTKVCTTTKSTTATTTSDDDEDE
jgi:hypothetical protein